MAISVKTNSSGINVNVTKGATVESISSALNEATNIKVSVEDSLSQAISKASEASVSASSALSSANNSAISASNSQAYAQDAANLLSTLNNVDNTSDLDKPISNATQTALNTKVDKVTSTDNAVVRFNGTTGEVQNSSVIIDDNGNVGIGNTSDNNTRRLVFTTAGGGSSAIESVTIGSTHQVLVFKTTYATESEKMILTGPGSLLLTSGTGALGYGTGAGGTVTQLTSKSTAVTLNKPTGQIIMNNSALAAGSLVYFIVFNSLFSANDTVIVNFKGGGIDYSSYGLKATSDGAAGYFYITVDNRTASSKSEAVQIKYEIIKGAVA